MKKKMKSIGLVLCLLFSFSSCGNNDKNLTTASYIYNTEAWEPEGNTDDTSSWVDIDPDETAVHYDEDDTDSDYWVNDSDRTAADVEVDTSATVTSPKVETFWDEYSSHSTDQIIQATSFSSGVAWVELGNIKTYSNGENYVCSSRKLLINTFGKPVFAFQSFDGYRSYAYTTNFVSDACQVSTLDGDQFLMGTDGGRYWDISIAWQDAIHRFGEGNVDNIDVLLYSDENGNCETLADAAKYYSYSDSFDGFTLIRIHVNTFEGSGYYYGIIRTNGSWVIEPTKAECVYFHPGNGFCALYVDSEHYYAYNLSNGESFNLMDESDEGQRHPDENNVVKGWIRRNKLANQCQIVYDSDQKAFVNDKGDIVIDMSQYSLSSDREPIFHNNYCVLLVDNPDGVPYYTVIDKSGNRLFEPIKVNMSSVQSMPTPEWAFVENDCFVMAGFTSYGGHYSAALSNDNYMFNSSVAENHCYYDLNTGKPKTLNLDENIIRVYPYHDDRALVETDNGYIFIDKNGNRIF